MKQAYFLLTLFLIMFTTTTSCTTYDQFQSTQVEMEEDLLDIASKEHEFFSQIKNSRGTRAMQEDSGMDIVINEQELQELNESLIDFCSKYKDLWRENQSLSSLSEDTIAMMLLDADIFMQQIEGKVSKEYLNVCKEVIHNNNTVSLKQVSSSHNMSANEKLSAVTMIQFQNSGQLMAPIEQQKAISCQEEFQMNVNDCHTSALISSAFSTLSLCVETAPVAPAAAVTGTIGAVWTIYSYLDCLQKAKRTYNNCVDRMKKKS